MSETASRNSTGAAVRCEALPPQGDPQSGRVSTLAFHWTRATSGDGKEAAQLNAPNHGSWLRRRPRESNFYGGIGCFYRDNSARRGGTVQQRTSERIIRANEG